MKNYTLQYLAHLVHKKNELNRRRRRFHALANPGVYSVKLHSEDPRFKKNLSCDYGVVGVLKTPYAYHSIEKPMHPAYSKSEAKNGYKKAQRDMKAMTQHMREVYRSLGVKGFIWSWSGEILGFRHEGKKYERKEIAHLAAHYVADSILIGE